MSDPEGFHTEHVPLEPPYSCQYHLAKVEQIMQQLQELHESVKQLNDSIKGNGKEGLIVRVDRNTNFRKGMTKLLWVLFTPLYGGLIALLFKILFSH